MCLRISAFVRLENPSPCEVAGVYATRDAPSTSSHSTYTGVCIVYFLTAPCCCAPSELVSFQLNGVFCFSLPPGGLQVEVNDTWHSTSSVGLNAPLPAVTSTFNPENVPATYGALDILSTHTGVQVVTCAGWRRIILIVPMAETAYELSVFEVLDMTIVIPAPLLALESRLERYVRTNDPPSAEASWYHRISSSIGANRRSSHPIFAETLLNLDLALNLNWTIGPNSRRCCERV